MDGASIRDNLAGAWALMNGRAAGLTLLDLSLDGFWRSFGAIGLILPFAAVALLGERAIVAAGGQAVAPLSGGLLLAHALALFADWLAFPLVLAALARPLGLGRSYVAFIVARNWASVIIGAISAMVYCVFALGLVPASWAPFLLLVTLGIALRFAYSVARTALAAPVGLAVPLVILDVVVSLFVEAAIGPGVAVQSGG